ncbi:MAG: FAD binding domain-containing protein [bacterium]|nr:FAD binding domain-containing protein [bacterium]
MRPELKKVHHPKTAEELLALLAAGGGRVAPAGGGVSFAFAIPPGVEELASLRALGLDRIDLDGDGLRIGAMATINLLARSPAAAGFRDGLLAEAASRVAATPNRNLITVGGNACRLFIWSDLPVVYCAAGARFRVRGAKGVRVLSCEEFYRGTPLDMIGRAEYLEEIVIPPAAGRAGDAHRKFFETHNQFGLVSAAASVTLDEAGACRSARLCLGGLRLNPAVSAEAAGVLEGREPSPDRLREAAEAAVAAVKVVRDVRMSDEYKRALAATVGREALEAAFERARERR